MNALLLKPRAIGDVILLTAMLRALKRARPEARIVVATEPFCAPVLENNPNVDEVVAFPRTTRATVAFVSAVRRRHLDVVIDAFGNPRTALVTALSGARRKIGYDVRIRRFAYGDVVRRLPAGTYNPRVQMELLRPLGVDPDAQPLLPEVILPKEERARASVVLRGLGVRAGDRVIGVNPGGSWATKRWWTNRYARLATELAERPRHHVLVLWGPGEERLRDEVVAGADHARVRPIPGGTLRDMMALVDRMDLLVTNDGAPKHIAVALGTPTLALHGPTDPRAWHPPTGPHRVLVGDVPCKFCELTACGHRSCMVKLTVPAVASAARAVAREN